MPHCVRIAREQIPEIKAAQQAVKKAQAELVDLNQHLAGLYALVVFDVHLPHRSRDAGAQRGHVRPDVGVVGLLFHATAGPCGPPAIDHKKHQPGDNQNY
jgi:hypothetical protein